MFLPDGLHRESHVTFSQGIQLNLQMKKQNGSKVAQTASRSVVDVPRDERLFCSASNLHKSGKP